jgi:hypothetical protein
MVNSNFEATLPFKGVSPTTLSYYQLNMPESITSWLSTALNTSGLEVPTELQRTNAINSRRTSPIPNILLPSFSPVIKTLTGKDYEVFEYQTSLQTRAAGLRTMGTSSGIRIVTNTGSVKHATRR